MSISQFSKDHGLTIAGIGGAFLAAAIGYGASVVDRALDKFDGMITQTKATAEKIETVAVKLEGYAVQFRNAMPDVGNEIGETAGNAVNTLQDSIDCKNAPADKPCDPAKGWRGLVNKGIQKMQTPPAPAN